MDRTAEYQVAQRGTSKSPRSGGRTRRGNKSEDKDNSRSSTRRSNTRRTGSGSHRSGSGGRRNSK